MKNFLLPIFLIMAFTGTSYAERYASSEAPIAVERSDEYQARIKTKVVKKVKLPSGYHEGLYFDGANIWVANGKGRMIWVVDPSSGKVLSEIEPVGTFAEAITSAGDGTYWYTDWDAKKIYRVKIADGKMEVQYDISLDDAHPAGAVWTGDKLFLITWTRSISGTKFHLLQLDENEKMFRKMQIKRILEPAHMAWDGKNLWVTSWYNQLVYRIDVNTFKVTGSFGSPAPDTTGIAWDGKYFWITGTHADLYQVEISEDKEVRSEKDKGKRIK